MDLVDSKNKITYNIFTTAKTELAGVFSRVLYTKVTLEYVVLRLKESMYRSFGAFIALNGILRNQKKYFDEQLFSLSTRKSTSTSTSTTEDKTKGTSLASVLLHKHNLLNELYTASRTLCMSASKNELNQEEYAELYDMILSAFYALSRLNKSLDLAHLQQALDHFIDFQEIPSLRERVENFLSNLIRMYMHTL